MPTSRHSPAKDQQVFVVCYSAAITAGDISEVLTALKSLSSDRSSAMSAEGAVTLVFHGYDDDPRELEAIPEVREWFAKLFEVWPYWSFFASRIDQTVPLVLTLLLPGETVAGEPGMVGWSIDLDELKPLLMEMFCHQNELIERLEIGEDVNERVTRDFIEAVRAFFN
ncbi:MAG: chlororespiratory reduction 6 domain-containing protein [Sulfuricellaceae bacterium]|nr:chlororespiratory reduction 6 domain-containing protein [Sulfuricellaceae bacterium]